MISYKYFIIYNRNKEIIYGECITWLCGEFDSLKQSDKTINLKKKHKARFIVSNTKLDELNEEQEKILIPEDISLQYKDSFTDFISLRSDENLFNPLIDRCSKIKMLVGDELTSDKFQDWIEDHKILLDEINEKFKLDLSRNPELINSFTYYEPTRIIVNSKFTDKPTRGESRLPTNLEVQFYDEFNKYENLNYTIIGYCDDIPPHITEGSISDQKVLINFNQSPDILEILVTNNQSTIYNSKHGFIRNIQFRGTIVGDSVELENGKKVDKKTELNFNVGKYND